MARWGEGDPRWIVEERPDATNVNNWHWTEKNATPWSKERFQQLFQDLKIAQGDIICTIENIEKCTGEATANNRKGKLIFFYEWELVLKWKGQLNATAQSHEGKITIPNLSEENDLNDVEITVTIDESNGESETLKQFMYNIGRDKIRHLLEAYVKELKEEYSKGLILPKKGEDSVSGDLIKEEVKKSSKGFNNSIPEDGKTKDCSSKVGCKLDVQTLIMHEEFQCNANDLYNALTRAEMLTAFTRSPAKVVASRGGEFSLYAGNVQGKFEELVPEKKICQTWRLKNWPSGHYSNVSIELEETRNSTQMTLKQTGIPSAEYESMKSNWNRYYWHSIKQTFGFGAALLDGL